MHSSGSRKPPIIVNINEITTMSRRKKGINSSAGIMRVRSRNMDRDVTSWTATSHRRVTERSEPSFEKDTTQRTARTAASSSELRANVHACFWMMRFSKRFAVTCRAKSEPRNFLRSSDPSRANGAGMREQWRSWRRVAPAEHAGIGVVDVMLITLAAPIACYRLRCATTLQWCAGTEAAQERP
jgi:hypothetical protein